MEESNMEEYKTYKILSDNTFGYKYIQLKGSGKLPQKLKGVFTSPKHAKIAIDNYLLLKGIKNDEADKSPRA